MTGVAIVTAVSAAASIGAQIKGQRDARRGQETLQRAQEEQTQASIRAERAREKQARLEALRRRRKIIREAIATRSLALSRGVAATGGTGSSSVQSALGQPVSQAAEQLVAVDQNQQLTSDVFAANEAFAQAGGRVNQARADINTANRLQQTGQNIIRNLGTINRVGLFLEGRDPDTSLFG